jgi:hypothetical protein
MKMLLAADLLVGWVRSRAPSSRLCWKERLRLTGALDMESPRTACSRSRFLVGKTIPRRPYLLDWINRFKPDIVLSGHMHNAPFYPQGSWIDRISDTWVYNPGREPGPIPTHLNLDLEAMSAEWISAECESIRQLRLSDR